MEELERNIAVLQAHCNNLQEGSAKEAVRYALELMKERLRKDWLVLEDHGKLVKGIDANIPPLPTWHISYASKTVLPWSITP